MGLSASQARLLSITQRINNNELESEMISNAKIQLAARNTIASENYINALDGTKLEYISYDDSGTQEKVNLTFNSINQYTPLKNQYALFNNENQIYVSSTDAANFENSDNLYEFLECYGLFDRGRDEYNEKMQEYKDQMDEYNKEKDEYDKALGEYNNQMNDYNEKLNDYNEKLQDGIYCIPVTGLSGLSEFYVKIDAADLCVATTKSAVEMKKVKEPADLSFMEGKLSAMEFDLSSIKQLLAVVAGAAGSMGTEAGLAMAMLEYLDSIRAYASDANSFEMQLLLTNDDENSLKVLVDAGRKLIGGAL